MSQIPDFQIALEVALLRKCRRLLSGPLMDAYGLIAVSLPARASQWTDVGIRRVLEPKNKTFDNLKARILDQHESNYLLLPIPQKAG